MADEREEIRARIDIAELVGREIPLRQRGKHWTGLCPFHADKNPSFTVSPQTGRFRCWSCQATGDIFDWVMRRRNVDFAEALQVLAKEAGVTLRRGGGLPPSTRQAHEKAMEVALAFFRDQFQREPAAHAYCRARGLDEESVDQWQIGYAPDSGELLPFQLKKNDISLSEAKQLFLVDEDSSGGYYARFRRRLMFPIHDEKGALVAFGGRLLGDGHPKYVNSSDTPIFKKSRVLYGMNRAREAISESRRAVLVEGYLDVIACHRAGVRSAIASLGTSLAEDHAKLLKRWCDEVIILYDSDEAGQKAAVRAIEILRGEGLRSRVSLLPPGEDPDTLLKSSGGPAVQAAVERAITPTDYRLQQMARRLQPQNDDYWIEAAEILAAEPSEIEVVRHLDRLAGIYPATRDVQLAKRAIRGTIARVKKAAIEAGLMTAPASPKRTRREVTSHIPGSPLAGQLKSSELVVFLAFLSEDFRTDGWRLVRATDLFESGVARRLSEAVARTFPDAPPQGRPAEWLPNLGDSEVEAALADLTLDSRGDRLTETFISGALQRLHEAHRRRQVQAMRQAGADLGDIHRLLLELNPDTLQKPSQEDDHF